MQQPSMDLPVPGHAESMEDLKSQFLALPARETAPSGLCTTNLHIFCRQLGLTVDPPARLAFGIMSESRYVQFTVPIKMELSEQRADVVYPMILEKLCKSFVYHEHAHLLGRPCKITCADPALATFLSNELGRNGTTVDHIDEQQTVISGPKDGTGQSKPLVSVTDAVSVQIEDSMRNLLFNGTVGFEQPPEAYRESRSRPGSYHSKVEHPGLEVPLRLCCCSGCKLLTSEATLKRCARCLIARYCTRNCQKTDWKQGKHKHQCKNNQVNGGR
mmetsp:Transcript_14308/g.23437  ORF Transcript_14308/g.23437 Transcript_14308/m.23437 type:complete len:273 (-) Transcript_14308:241-1059(-)